MNDYNKWRVYCQSFTCELFVGVLCCCCQSISDTVEVCSCRVEEKIMSKRLQTLEYAIVTLFTLIGVFVLVLLNVRMLHVLSVSFSRVFCTCL